MLIGIPTKHAAGITIFGDYYDLKSIHESIHSLVQDGPFSPSLGDFVLGLAYEVRRSYQNDRQNKVFGRDSLDQVSYRGFDSLWPVILVQISLLRWAAGFVPTSRAIQSDLYRLESCIEIALSEISPQLSHDCLNWIRTLNGLPENYLIEFITHQSRIYVTKYNTKSKRLQVILQLLEEINPI